MVYNRKNFLKEFVNQKNEISTYGNIKKNMYFLLYVESNISLLLKKGTKFKSILIKTT